VARRVLKLVSFMASLRMKLACSEYDSQALPRPYMIEEAWRRMELLIAKPLYGLTPVSRIRVRIPPTPPHSLDRRETRQIALTIARNCPNSSIRTLKLN
jgi:hypothetical protein